MCWFFFSLLLSLRLSCSVTFEISDALARRELIEKHLFWRVLFYGFDWKHLMV